jgi:hypothetical protein
VVLGLAALLLGVAFLLLLAPVRSRLLVVAISVASAALPGDIETDRLAWPSLGSIEVTGVRWTDGEFLFRADRVTVSVDGSSLLHRDVRVNEVGFTGVTADLPAIRSRLTGRDDVSAEDSGEANRSPIVFLREGSWPGLPSLAVEQVAVTADSIRWSPDVVLTDLEIAGALDISSGSRPENAVRVDGRGHVSLSPDLSLFVSLASDTSGGFTIVVSESESLVPPGDPGIELHARLDRDGTLVRSVAFDAIARSPAAADLPSHLTSRLGALPFLEGVTLETQGVLQLDPQLAVEATCEIRENSWQDGGEFTVGYRNDILMIDRVSLALDDLAIEGSTKLAPICLTRSPRTSSWRDARRAVAERSRAKSKCRHGSRASSSIGCERAATWNSTKSDPRRCSSKRVPWV